MKVLTRIYIKDSNSGGSDLPPPPTHYHSRGRRVLVIHVTTMQKKNLSNFRVRQYHYTSQWVSNSTRFFFYSINMNFPRYDECTMSN